MSASEKSQLNAQPIRRTKRCASPPTSIASGYENLGCTANFQLLSPKCRWGQKSDPEARLGARESNRTRGAADVEVVGASEVVTNRIMANQARCPRDLGFSRPLSFYRRLISGVSRCRFRREYEFKFVAVLGVDRWECRQPSLPQLA